MIGTTVTRFNMRISTRTLVKRGPIHLIQPRCASTATPSATQPARPSWFARNYADPLAMYVKGLGQISLDMRQGITLWIDSRFRKRDKVVRRVDIRNLMRIKVDFVKAGPLLLFLPALPLLPALKPLLSKFPSLAPSTFHTVEMIDAQLKTLSAQRNALVPQAQQVFLKYFHGPDGKSTFSSQLYQQQIHSSLEALQLPKKSKITTAAVYRALTPLITTAPSSVNLISLTSDELQTCAKLLSLPSSFIMPSPRLYQWADWILKDDLLINKDGVGSLAAYELIEALIERGFTGFSTSFKMVDLRNMLTAHVTFTRDCIDKIRRQRKEKGVASVPLGEHGLEPHEVTRVAFLLLAARAIDARPF